MFLIIAAFNRAERLIRFGCFGGSLGSIELPSTGVFHTLFACMTINICLWTLSGKHLYEYREE